MRRANSKPAVSQPIPVLFDIEVAGELLSLPVDVVDRLERAGWLTASVTIGNARFFSKLDLEKFAHPDTPRQIDLNDRARGRAPGLNNAIGLRRELIDN